jgi:hypothetical protein
MRPFQQILRFSWMMETLRFLAIVDLAQIKRCVLNHAVALAAPVLHQRPVVNAPSVCTAFGLINRPDACVHGGSGLARRRDSDHIHRRFSSPAMPGRSLRRAEKESSAAIATGVVHLLMLGSERCHFRQCRSTYPAKVQGFLR